jgi:hypothetical protein
MVLRRIGEGIAGSRHLGLPGTVGFAVIHTVFFVLLALLYAALRAKPTASRGLHIRDMPL